MIKTISILALALAPLMALAEKTALHLETDRGTNSTFRHFAKGDEVWIIKGKGGRDLTPLLPPSKHKRQAHLGMHILRADPELAHSLIKSLRQAGALEYAVRDRIVSVDALPVTPNDPLYTNQWDMLKVGAPAAWGVSQGSSNVVAAVVDTGIDYTHPDLIPNLYTFPDGSHGWQCYQGVLTNGGADVFGHGTHCAGTIAAVGNNGIGMAGINWNVRLLSMAFLDSNGSGLLSDAIAIMDKMCELKTNGVNIVTANNSWGGIGTPDAAMIDAFQALCDAGILPVCAAGNNAVNIDQESFTPACAPVRGIIAVMASDPSDDLAYFSNRGLIHGDISAPGLQTFSTLPTNAAIHLNNPSGYGFLSGTSMATPHVTGEAAELASINPALTVYELHDTILNRNSYDLMADFNGSQSETGGRISLAKATVNPLLSNPKTNSPPQIPDPQDVPSLHGGDTLKLSFTAADPDGDPLRYVVYDSAGNLPYTLSNSVTYATPNWAVDNVLNVTEAALDNNGGSATVHLPINVLKSPTFIPDVYGITASAVVSNYLATNLYMVLTVAYSTNSNPASSATFRVETSSSGALWGNYFFPIPYTVTIPILNTNDQYKAMVIAENKELTIQSATPIYFSTGTASIVVSNFPRLNMTFDRTEGVVPMTVNYDTAGSWFPLGFGDFSFGGYFYVEEDGVLQSDAWPSKGSFTITNPGVHNYQFTFFNPDVGRGTGHGYSDYQLFQFIALAPTTNSPPTDRPGVGAITSIKGL